MASKLKERNWTSRVVPYWAVLLNQNGGYPLRTTVERFMNVYVVDLILPKMMRMWTPNHLCVGETVSYFVPKQFRKHRLKQVKSKGITLLECYCRYMRRNDQKSCIYPRIIGPSYHNAWLQGDSLQRLAWLIIAEIMVYFFISIVQCMQLSIDRRIMVCTFVY